MKRGERSANLIDCLRVVAAFAIVWHHSDFLRISSEYLWVVTWRGRLIAWALPFFYLTLTLFTMRAIAKRGFDGQMVRRQVKFLLWVVVYGGLFILGRGVAGRLGRPTPLFPFVWQDNVSWWWQWWEWFRAGGYSPLYFLVNGVVIAFMAWGLVELWRRWKWGWPWAVGGMVLVAALGVVNERVARELYSQVFYLPETAVAGVVAGLAYGYIELLNLGSCRGLFFKRVLSVAFPQMRSSLIACGSPGGPPTTATRGEKKMRLSWWVGVGVMVLGYGWIGDWPSMGWRVVGMTILGWISLVMLVNGGEMKGKVAEMLSGWGRKYALGVYLVHPFVTGWLDFFLPRVGELLGRGQPLMVYLMVNILGFGISLVVVRWLYRMWPWWVKV